MQQSITMLSLRTQIIAAIIIIIGVILFWIGIFRLTHYFDVSMNITILVQAIFCLAFGIAAKISGLIICLRNGDNDWFQMDTIVQTQTLKNVQAQTLKNEISEPKLGLGKTLLGLFLSKALTVILPFLSFFFGIALIFSKTLGIISVFIFFIFAFISAIAFFDIATRKKRRMYGLANRATELQQEDSI